MVDMKGLTRNQRRAINRLRKQSSEFAKIFDAVDAADFTVHLLNPRNANERTRVGIINGGGFYDATNKEMIFSLSTDARHPDDHAEFESLVAHEFQHAAAGLPGGAPIECAGDEQCAVDEQNKVHRQIGYRDRKDHKDAGPFKKP